MTDYTILWIAGAFLLLFIVTAMTAEPIDDEDDEF